MSECVKIDSQDVQKSIKTIMDLDQLTMMEIFDFLSGKTLIECSAVCKSWNEMIGTNKIFMRKMRLEINEKTQLPLVLGKNYQSVCIYGINVQDDNMITLLKTSFASTVPFVTELDMIDVSINKEHFVELINSFNNLKILTLNAVTCPKIQKNQTRTNYQFPSSMCLNKLVLNRSDSVALMNVLIDSNIQTRTVEFTFFANQKNNYHQFIGQQRNLESVITNGFSKNFEHVFKQMIRLPALQTLKRFCLMNRPRIGLYCSSTDDEYPEDKIYIPNTYFILFLQKHGEFLRDLHIDYNIDNELIETIAKHMKLEKLSLTNTGNLRAVGLSSIKENYHLKTLILRTKAPIEDLCRIYPNIETLRFVARTTTDFLSKLHNLKNLYFSRKSRSNDSLGFFIPSLKVLKICCSNYECFAKPLLDEGASIETLYLDDLPYRQSNILMEKMLRLALISKKVILENMSFVRDFFDKLNEKLQGSTSSVENWKKIVHVQYPEVQQEFIDKYVKLDVRKITMRQRNLVEELFGSDFGLFKYHSEFSFSSCESDLEYSWSSDDS